MTLDFQLLSSSGITTRESYSRITIIIRIGSPAADSPTADSPGYIPESDPEEDPEEDDDEDPKEDPTDYPADEGDDGDDEDEPSDDDEDEEVDIEADDEEEEEHPAPVDSTAVALPTIDQAPSAEETELGCHTSRYIYSTIITTFPMVITTTLDSFSTTTPDTITTTTTTTSDSLTTTTSIALGPRYEIRESSSAAVARPARSLRVDYGFVATMDREIRHDLERDVGYGINDS
ncbi:hypothetical protein Tco_1574392 [Tanacetum coccineum]